jgi:hypothetical protein
VVRTTTTTTTRTCQNILLHWQRCKFGASRGKPDLWSAYIGKGGDISATAQQTRKNAICEGHDRSISDSDQWRTVCQTLYRVQRLGPNERCLYTW